LETAGKDFAHARQGLEINFCERWVVLRRSDADTENEILADLLTRQDQGAEHPLPDCEDFPMIAVPVLRLGAVMDLMMRG
jgi:hypothetical protein